MGLVMVIVATETPTVRRVARTDRHTRSSVVKTGKGTAMVIATRHLATIPRVNLVVRAPAMTQNVTALHVMIQSVTDRRVTVLCAMAPRPRMTALLAVMRNVMTRSVKARTQGWPTS